MEFEHIFDDLEITTDPFAVCELRGACDLGLGRDASATLHYILAGEGEIRLRSQAPLKVSRGTLVLIPALQSHALHSFGVSGDPVPDCKPAAINLARLMATAECGDKGQLIALCAHVDVGLRGVADIIDLIREPLVENVSSPSSMRSALQALLYEISNPGLGSRAMIRALLTQCMIEMLRRRLAVADNALHWMAALADQTVWSALRTMLDKPGDRHTVESLADSVSMSRAAFAKRFADAYGSGPMELLRDLRMRRAGALLRDTDLPVKRIAEMVGFTSRSAFSRTFEAKTGQPPRAFRMSLQEN
ncbi:AraC family transcriptional regulator [Parasedimentitalea marina]|uniref:AraC family transcriptional regulator n=1 Tax=Parasedimentitalea marina TaxID=2483033 RepID=A0A3T0N3U1_9RHOB|nr:AraC family transcriptional regulator [Parasedimentitalea marina]AZV78651.1 AraC family transcriptional regulator [Parasedimentitalea marina]